MGMEYNVIRNTWMEIPMILIATKYIKVAYINTLYDGVFSSVRLFTPNFKTWYLNKLMRMIQTCRFLTKKQ